MYNTKISHKNKSLSLLHINACSPNKTLEIFYIFGVAISETRITKQVLRLNNLNRNNYSYGFNLTDTSAGVKKGSLH